MELRYGSLDRALQGLSRRWILGLAVAGVAVIGVVDYRVGSTVSLALVYLGPISLATWYAGRTPGAVVAVLSSLCALAPDLAAGHLRPQTLVWGGLLNLAFMWVVAFLLATLRDQIERAQTLARSDSLTGVFNRRAFLECLRTHLGLAERDGKPTTLAYVDLDDFKRINDSLGHEAGDEALRLVAVALRESIRHTDIVARLGGDEFGLLLVGADQVGAVGVIAKVRHAVWQLSQRKRIAITCSIGCLTFEAPPPTPSTALRAADALMYRVKRRGKNGVAFELFGDRTSPGKGVAGTSHAANPELSR
jgi:diguanylate cyclase (GGDEF)-like protein